MILCLLTLIVIGSVWIYMGNTQIKVTSYEIKSSKITQDFHDFKIVQVSDLHNATFGKEQKNLIKLIEQQQPDIIAVTGDLIDSRRTNIEVAMTFIKKAITIAPVYYVNGNHEARIKTYDSLVKQMVEAGVIILDDARMSFEKGNSMIDIMGLVDPDFFDDDLNVSSSLDTRIKQIGVDKHIFTILLSHRPEYFKAYVKHELDLVLSGHAHGGQIRLPWIGGIYAPNQGFFPQYAEGQFIENKTSMIVSRGLGNSIIPIRVNNNPELITIILKQE